MMFSMPSSWLAGIRRPAWPETHRKEQQIMNHHVSVCVCVCVYVYVCYCLWVCGYYPYTGMCVYVPFKTWSLFYYCQTAALWPLESMALHPSAIIQWRTGIPNTWGIRSQLHIAIRMYGWGLMETSKLMWPGSGSNGDSLTDTGCVCLCASLPAF